MENIKYLTRDGLIENPDAHRLWIGKKITVYYRDLLGAVNEHTGRIYCIDYAIICIQEAVSLKLITLDLHKNPATDFIMHDSPEKAQFTYCGSSDIEEFTSNKSVYGLVVCKISNRTDVLLVGEISCPESGIVSVVYNNTTSRIDIDIQKCVIWISNENLCGETYFIPTESAYTCIDAHKELRKKVIKEFFDKKSSFRDIEYINFLSRLKLNLRKLLHRWYRIRNDYDIIDGFLAGINDNLLPLFCDWALYQRREEFLDFLSKKKHCVCSKNTGKIIKEYKEYLGFETVYRGMMLTDGELAQVKKHGILAQAYRSEDNFMNTMLAMFTESDPERIVNWPCNVKGQVHCRRNSYYDRKYSTLISVSSYKDIAMSIGYHVSGCTDDKTKRMYVFECRVPKLYLIEIKDEFAYEHLKASHIRLGSKFFEITDIGVEKFVPFKINKEEIMSIELVNEIPIEWRWYNEH